ncbi:twin-arginine translocation signal domain-containing protein [Streptomyces umbrinus]|uniref:twin-arginine translocation signal domain-containing protein n=1 Tax=Streptomyces umbrinus TaxID=67370 RepID=UPI0033EEB3AF
MTGTHKDTTITRRRAIAVTGVAGGGGGGGTPRSGEPGDAPGATASSTDTSS